VRDLYYIIFRHKWKAVLFFFAVTITVTLYTFQAPEVYRSDAKLIVRPGRENVTLQHTATTGQIISIGQPRKSEINSELEILRSRELAGKVADAIGLKTFSESGSEVLLADASTSGTVRHKIKDFCQRVRATAQNSTSFLEHLGLRAPLNADDKAILTVMKTLDINVPENSNIISISYQAKCPKLAQQVVDKLIHFYLEKHIAMHRTFDPCKFFAQQRDQLRATLAKTAKDLRDLKNTLGIASLNEQRSIILNRIGTLHQEMDLTDAALSASQVKVEELRRQIAQAQTPLQKEDATRAQVTKELNAAHQQVQLALVLEEATLFSLQAKAETLREHLTSAQDELKVLNDSELRIAQLEREMNIQEANYRMCSDKLEQSRINHALDSEKVSNIIVVQPASHPIKPVRPHKMLNLALGFFSGVFGGIGLAFFAQYLDHSFKTPEDVEKRLGLPTLVAIPRVRAKKRSLKTKTKG